MEGEVTTNLAGNITDWDITYRIIDVTGSGIRVLGPSDPLNPPPPLHASPFFAEFRLSSTAPIERTIFPSIINGAASNEAFTYTEGDTLFSHSGIQYLHK